MFCNPHIQRLKWKDQNLAWTPEAHREPIPHIDWRGSSVRLLWQLIFSLQKWLLLVSGANIPSLHHCHTHTHTSTAYYVCFGPLYISRSSLHQESLQVFCFSIVSHLYACLSLLVFDMFTVITVQGLLSNSFLCFTFQDIRSKIIYSTFCSPCPDLMYLNVYELFIQNKVILHIFRFLFLMHSLEYLILWSDVFY